MRQKVLIFLIFLLISSCSSSPEVDFGDQFIGERAYKDVIAQVDFGARYVGSTGHEQLQRWLVQKLEEYGWIGRAHL
jgi:hypothetical protein